MPIKVEQKTTRQHKSLLETGDTGLLPCSTKQCTPHPIPIEPLSLLRAIALSSLSELYKCRELLALLHVCQCETGFLLRTVPGPKVYGVSEPQLSLLNRNKFLKV